MVFATNAIGSAKAELRVAGQRELAKLGRRGLAAGWRAAVPADSQAQEHSLGKGAG